MSDRPIIVACNNCGFVRCKCPPERYARPERKGYKLAAWAEDAYASFMAGGPDCACHVAPPCGTCTEPGNPENLAEDDSAWVPA